MSDDIFTQTNTTVPDTEAAPYRTATEFRPLPTAEDYSDEPKKKTYGNDAEGLREAAQSLTEAREVPKVAEDAPITKRDYHWNAGQGDRVPDHFTLDAKRAAEDLSRVRMAEVEIASPAQELTSAIDEVRNAWNQTAQPQQPAQPQPEVQAQTAEALQQQPQDPTDQVRQVLEQHPAVRNALAAELAATEQHRAAYAQGLRQSATVAAASLLANFPELAQVPTEHLQSAITAIAATNPQRAAAIDAQLGRTQSLFNEFKKVEAAQQQAHTQNVQAWAAHQDRIFESEVASKETPETMRKIAENVVALAEEYGVSQQELAEVWKSQPILRTAAFQRMLVDAARYRIATSEAAAKVHKPVPNVQRPGVARDNSGDDSGVERALAKFRSDPSPKTGADLLRARRDATRR